ncbi:M24 family metallopeptidase [Pseudomonas sp. H11T01]|uniref:M24 family metallopeptidase n=1 Tax=Pseudomonas sp. H11T01 TaxID=3402749 RepID=UPI003ACE1463
MQREGVDVLLAQSGNDFTGGYVKYLADAQPFGGFNVTVVFTRDRGTTAITSGKSDDLDMSADVDGPWRGVDRLLTAPSFSAAGWSAPNEQRNIIKALAGFGSATVGLLGTQQISMSTMDAIREAYPAMRFVDASNFVDAIKSIKSPEEQSLLRLTCQQQDEAMLAVINEIRPGMLDRDVTILLQEISGSLGSTQGLYVAASGNRDSLALPKLLPDQRRRIGEGDMVHVFIESNGPSGLYAHLTRTVVLGKTPSELSDELKFALRAQAFTVDRLRPGARPVDILREYNEFLRENGRPEEHRVHCHGQGFDIAERPFITPEETMTIQAGMYLACHPLYVHRGYFNWVCSNFLITDDGAEQLHQLPVEIYER